MTARLSPPVVHKLPPLPVMDLNDAICLLKSKCAPFETNVVSEGANVAFVLPQAVNEMKTFFNVGQRTPNNYLEARAKLFGHKYRDSDGKLIFIVTKCMYIYCPIREHTFVQTTIDGAPDAMEFYLKRELDFFNKYELQIAYDASGFEFDPFIQSGGVSQIIGGIHSHPGFGAFNSEIDYAENESTVNCPQLYMVVDPIKVEYDAICAVGGEKCGIILLENIPEPKKEESKLSTFINAGLELLNSDGVDGNWRLTYDKNNVCSVKLSAKVDMEKAGG